MSKLSRTWLHPVALLVLGMLSFGLLITSLGFYWDDWPFLMIARQQGPEGYAQFFAFDRPTTAWSYLLLMPVFGTNPLAWQIFSLVMRVAAGVALWWFVAGLWPKARSLAAWTAFLFVVYPVFRQQPIAMVYHQVWLEYFAFLVSLAAMVAAIAVWKTGNGSRFWLLTLLALLALAANLFISEYFVGVELVRGAIVWLALQQFGLPWRKRLLDTLRLWAPYLVVTAVYIVWRLFLVDFANGDRNETVMISALFTTPLQAVAQLLQMALKDSLHIVVSNWYDALTPALFDVSSRFQLLTWGVGLLAFAFSFVYLLKVAPFGPTQESGEPENEQDSLRAYRQAAALGALLVLFGPAPAWATGRMVTEGAFSDRLALSAMFGAGLLLAGLVGWFIRSRVQQVILISLLVALATGHNLRVANDFRWVRIVQNRLYWQLYWRAPYLEPNTALFSDGEILSKMGLRSTSYGINLLYPLNLGSPRLNYWFFSLGREFNMQMPQLLSGMPLQVRPRHFAFDGNSQNSLVLYYQPQEADCLRVLTPEDGADPSLPEISRQALPVINLQRIQPEARHEGPPEDIFGPEPERGWCYLFQKADLARQVGDWEGVVEQGDLAQEQGFNLQNSQSNTPQEWIPFIEGYAQVGRWQEASEISLAVLEIKPEMAGRLCTLWGRLARETRSSLERDAVLPSVQSAAACPVP